MELDQVTKGGSDAPGSGENRMESREAGRRVSSRGGTGRQYQPASMCSAM